MTTIFPAVPRLFVMLIVTAVFAAIPSVARADEITITGSTGACFFGCTIVAPNTSVLNLVYNGAHFSGSTVGGLLGIGAAPNQSNNVNNLGSFRLNDIVATNYANIPFTLVVTFTSPDGINSGNNPVRFTSLINGSVNSNHQGGAVIDFDNTPVLFTYSGINGSGAFLFNVNDVSVTANGLVPVTGTIRVTTSPAMPTPEPATLLLLGTGITGVAAGLRRRSRNGTD